MIAECVGLDIGQTAFKAVRFRRRLTGRESVEYFHLPVPYGRQEHTEPAHRSAMLRNFLWQHGLYGSGEIVTALSCQDVFVRTLSFPFRDASKLAQVVPFEMENLIPMPLEDVTVGSLLLPARESKDGTAKGKGSDVLVTAAPKEKIAEHLRFMASADLNPSAITIDGMALFSVSQFLKEEGAQVPGDMAIIDVGASKTTLCLVHEGRPVLLRTVLWGGNHLTLALAVRYACSFAEAERRKRAMAVQEVDAWLEPVLKELRVSLHAYEGTVHQRLTHCWVSGGGSKLRELSGHMATSAGLTPGRPAARIRIKLPPRVFHCIRIGDPSEHCPPPLEVKAGGIRSRTGLQSRQRCRIGHRRCLETGSPVGHMGRAHPGCSGARGSFRTRDTQGFDGQGPPTRDPGAIRASIWSGRRPG